MNRIAGWAVAALLTGTSAYADTIDYQVTDYAPASIKVAGDGTVFVDYVNPTPGMTYHFGLNLWVEEGGAAAFPSESVPVNARKLSGTDISGWFTLNPAEAVFTGYGGDPASEGGTPTGAYVPILVSVAVPSTGLPTDGQVQVKIQADTSKIKHLGNGHGIIVRFSGFSGGGEKDPKNPGGGGGHGSGCCCHSAFAMTSWLADASYKPMCAYKNKFEVMTDHGKVRSVEPGSFTYNVLVAARKDVKDLTLNVLPLHGDFVLAGRTEGKGKIFSLPGVPRNFYVMENSVQVYVGDPGAPKGDRLTGSQIGNRMTYGPVSLKAGGVLFLSVHFRYNRCTVNPGYLPKIYSFSAVAKGAGTTRAAASRMIGVPCCPGHHDEEVRGPLQDRKWIDYSFIGAKGPWTSAEKYARSWVPFTRVWVRNRHASWTIPVSLAYYTTDGPTWPTSGRQVLFSFATAKVPAGGVRELKTNSPGADVFGQTDLYHGSTIYDGKRGPDGRYLPGHGPSPDYNNRPEGIAPKATELITGWNGGKKRYVPPPAGRSGGSNNGRDQGKDKGGPKGNNGVGNGEDPQPPGNPPVNDGAGTGPGNPGNKGGAKK